MRFTQLALGLASSALLPAAARADFTVTRTSVFTVDALVPDGGYTFDARTIDLGGATVLDVNVGLVLTPVSGDSAWAGDYYAALGHDTGYAVLLNRIGKTATDSFGNGANGLSVIFDDSASAGDIHAAPYDSNSANPPALTDTWAPDAREADPALVTTTSPRTALLSSFNGTSTDGEWRLLVADDSYGASARLTSWSLAVTFTPTSGAVPALTATDKLTVTTGTLDLSTPRTVHAQIVNQGLIVGPSASGQALTFTGHVTGSGNFQGNTTFLGSYSPGNSPAAVTFTGDTVFGPGHVLTLEIGGTTPGSGYDTLTVTGSLTYGGTFDVVFINGFLPSGSALFQFFTASSFGGSFAQLNLPGVAGYIWNTSRLNSEGIVQLVSTIPEPAAWAGFLGLGALGWAVRRRRRV